MIVKAARTARPYRAARANGRFTGHPPRSRSLRSAARSRRCRRPSCRSRRLAGAWRCHLPSSPQPPPRVRRAWYMELSRCACDASIGLPLLACLGYWCGAGVTRQSALGANAALGAVSTLSAADPPPRPRPPARRCSLSLIPVPSLNTHEPLAVASVIAMPDALAVARAASLVGGGKCSVAARLAGLEQSPAVCRTVAELLLARLILLPGACDDCSAGPQELPCASELGALEARMASIADNARLALRSTLLSPCLAGARHQE